MAKILGTIPASPKEVLEKAMAEAKAAHPELAAFYRVEEYLWDTMWKQAPGSDLREWYFDGWWATMTDARARQ